MRSCTACFLTSGSAEEGGRTGASEWASELTRAGLIDEGGCWGWGGCCCWRELTICRGKKKKDKKLMKTSPTHFSLCYAGIPTNKVVLYRFFLNNRLKAKPQLRNNFSTSHVKVWLYSVGHYRDPFHFHLMCCLSQQVLIKDGTKHVIGRGTQDIKCLLTVSVHNSFRTPPGGDITDHEDLIELHH